MTSPRCTLVAIPALLLVACGGAATSEATTPAVLPAESSPSSGGVGTAEAATVDAAASPSPDASSGPINVSGRPPGDNTIDVPGSSDLPPRIPSTMQPYARVIETAVAPIRAALGECARPTSGPARRMYRVTVGRDGVLSARPPQAFAFPSAVLACVDGVIRGTTVNPPPPMQIPYDIYFDVPR